MIKDSHAHIYLSDFDDDLGDVLMEAAAIGVQEIYMPNIDSSTIDRMHDTERKFPQCKSMMGLHPCYVKENYKSELTTVSKWLEERQYAAIGEIGIDLYWDKTFVDYQLESFRYQIHLAKEHGLSIIIHSRDSLEMTMDVVDSMQDGSLVGIFHCFNGSEAQAKKIIDMGFYLGIGGVITYKNAGLDTSIRGVPLSGLVLETDSPYLAPGPKRAKRNDPSKLGVIVQKLSEVMDIDQDEISRVTSANCDVIFKY